MTTTAKSWTNQPTIAAPERVQQPSQLAQRESLSEDTQKSLLRELIEEVRVYFDAEENRHRLEIDFKFEVEREPVAKKGSNEQVRRSPLSSGWVKLSAKGAVDGKKL